MLSKFREERHAILAQQQANFGQEYGIHSLFFSKQQYKETTPADAFAFIYSKEVVLRFKYPLLFDQIYVRISSTFPFLQLKEDEEAETEE